MKKLIPALLVSATLVPVHAIAFPNGNDSLTGITVSHVLLLPENERATFIFGVYLGHQVNFPSQVVGNSCSAPNGMTYQNIVAAPGAHR